MAFDRPPADIIWQLTRSDAEKLAWFITEIWQNMPQDLHNANRWLEFAEAKRLRQHSNDCGPGFGLQKGTLWELRSGEFFWTSYTGMSYKAHPLSN